jgi:hypothetical protein
MCPLHFIKDDQKPNNQLNKNWCLLVVMVCNLKRKEASWTPLFKLQSKTTRFGQLVIWFLVTLDKMKQEME